MAVIPPYCRKGDRIGLVAPAGVFPEAKITAALSVFRDRGFVPVLGKNALKRNGQFAGSDAERLDDLQTMIDDPEIKAIWCLRGGYGSARIVDQLNLEPLKQNPKWIVGLSDITTLLNHVHEHLDLVSIHGTMPVGFDNNSPEALDTVFSAINGTPFSYEIPAHPLNRTGQATGPLVGGNLSMLYSLSGTPSALNTEGKILFIEDLAEYLYHLDRMLSQLQRAGKLHGLKGLIVGAFTNMKDGRIPFGFTASEIIRQAVEAYDFPVCFEFPSGHIDDNRAWFHGREATLEVSDTVTLAFNG